VSTEIFEPHGFLFFIHYGNNFHFAIKILFKSLIFLILTLLNANVQANLLKLDVLKRGEDLLQNGIFHFGFRLSQLPEIAVES